MARHIRRWCGWRLTALLLAGMTSLAGAGSAVAADLGALDCSLKFVPDGAAFYSVTLKSGQRLQAIAHSKAWAQVKSLPIVQMGLNLYQLQSGIPGTWANQIEALRADPNVKPVIELVKDMFAQEVFVYGDKDIADFVALAQGLNTTFRFSGVAASMSGEPQDPQAQLSTVLTYLHENMDRIKVPGLLVGFRLSDVGRAQKELARLEELLGNVSAAVPQLQGHFGRTKVGKFEYLSLTLDGKLIPWKEVQQKLKAVEEDQGQAKELVGRLKKLTLTISLGVRENYLLLLIGPNNDLLGKLGQDKLLVHRSELAPLAQFAGESIASLGYCSRELKAAATASRKDMEELAHWFVDDVLPETAVDDEQHKRIEKDALDLARDIGTFLPEAGAASSIVFFKDHALESYGYDWSKYPKAEGSKPLDLLGHVGGGPLLAVAAASRCNVDDYNLLAKWLRTAYGYFQEFALPQTPEEVQEKFNNFMSRAKPLLKQIDTATRTQLIPALAAGQVAFALDGRLKSDHFLASTPATAKPMAMAEPALVFSISDAGLLRQAGQQYRQAVNGLLRAVHEINPENVPEVQIPEPQTASVAGGTLYYFDLPKDWGVDKQVLPNTALSDKVLCFSISKDHAQRLLKGTPLAQPGVLANAGQPRVAGLVLDWARLVDTAAPWVRLTADSILGQQAAANGDESTSGPMQPQAVKSQVETVLGLLKVLRSVTAEARLENGVTVQHQRTEIRDVQ